MLSGQSDGLSGKTVGVGRVTRSKAALQRKEDGSATNREESENGAPHRRKRQSLGDGRSYAPMLGMRCNCICKLQRLSCILLVRERALIRWVCGFVLSLFNLPIPFTSLHLVGW